MSSGKEERAREVGKLGGWSGSGAQHNPHNRFFKLEYGKFHAEGIDDWEEEEARTQFIEVHPKTIVNRVDSPDVGMMYSLNPYQGCEHGCTYCYARNSHEYWGYSAGVDFERKILVKKNAPVLLEKELQKPNWEVHSISLSGNTDCYQPAERKYLITRKCLEVLHKYNHPVGIITKNALVTRDVDILGEMAAKRLAGVSISITSLNEDTRRALEPRTASVRKRLEAVEILSKAGIPVNVMIAPVIPGITNHEVLPIIKAVADRGAVSVAHTIVRLNGAIGEIFYEWLEKYFPDRKMKVIHQIQEVHGGKLNDSRFGTRMRGEGNFADQVSQMMRLGREKYLKGKVWPETDRSLFLRTNKGQTSLF
ncbi:MAG: PA0069 family radical SAM protein [Bacteroidota bacterium]